MIPSQMLKGTLEGCILQIIRRKEIYGYEISEQLKGYGLEEISEGTIYPILLRLEKNESIEAVYKASATGPKRKYFHLTDKGRQELEQFLQNWEVLESAVNHIIKGEQKNQ